MAGNSKTYLEFRISVPQEFDEVFTHFYYAENKSNTEITKTLLPSYQTILFFSFGTDVTLHSDQNTHIILDKCLILGPLKKAFTYSLPPKAKILVANFKDDGFYRFFGHACVSANSPLHPDELMEENCFTDLWHELNKIEDAYRKVDFILEFCKPYLQQQSTFIKKLKRVDKETFNPIKIIAEDRNQSERNIQLNHKKQLGYSAKEINRYQRFLKAIALIQDIASSETEKVDWFEIIDQCGYYDQSQLIHDFEHYLNLTPTKYLKFQRDICVPSL